jgi:hypothetical protein
MFYIHLRSLTGQNFLFVETTAFGHFHSTVNPEIPYTYTVEITHDPFLFSVAQGIFWLSSERLSRSMYITINRGG